MKTKAAYQEIVDNALQATGARIVAACAYDPMQKEVRTEALASLDSRLTQRAPTTLKRFFPTFNLFNIIDKPVNNRLQQAVYLDGETASAPFAQIADGIVSESVIKTDAAIVNIVHAVVTPLTGGDAIKGSLTFLTGEAPTPAQRGAMEAFARQASLTLENARLLDALRAQVDELQRSRHLLVTAEERLRQEIAELLHGRVQTGLLVAWHRLGQSERLLETDLAAGKVLLTQARQEIDQIREREVRQVSHLLHPSIIRVGLAPAVRSLANRFAERFGISVDVGPALVRLDQPADNKIPETTRLAAYRILEEAFANIYRHAAATQVQVSLRVKDGQQIELVMRDDGCGFDARAVMPGLGMSIIAGRVGRAKGAWRIRSCVGKGTELSVTLPLDLGNPADAAEEAAPAIEDALPEQTSSAAGASPSALALSP